jgi:hypothetical protein
MLLRINRMPVFLWQLNSKQNHRVEILKNIKREREIVFPLTLVGRGVLEGFDRDLMREAVL